MAQNIRRDVGERIPERMPHAGLRRQMDDALDPRIGGAELGNRLTVGDVEALEAEPGLCKQALQSRLLQAHVVVRVQIVHAENFVAARQQRLRDMIADEPGGAGEQGGHARAPLRTRRI